MASKTPMRFNPSAALATHIPVLFQQAGAALPSVISEEAWKESPAPLSSFLQRARGAFAVGRIAERKGVHRARGQAPARPRLCPLPL